MSRRSGPPDTWRSVFYPPANYPYFETAPAFEGAPKVGKLNLLKAAWMADASALAYARSGERRMTVNRVNATLHAAGFAHVDLLGDWSGGSRGTQAYFARADDFAVLAFRGTEVEDWRDFAADLAAWPVAEDPCLYIVATAEKTMFHLPPARGVFNPEEAAVHRGFQNALNEVWNSAAGLLRQWRAHSRREVFFTGHSLGGALATLAISRFDGGHASLYTFGSPRVGNRTCAERLRRHAVLGHFRIVHRNDVVARVPPALLWYSHAGGTHYRIDGRGTIHDRTADPDHPPDAKELTRDMQCLADLRFPIDLDAQPPDDLYDHGIGRYCNCLWNAAL